MSLHGGPVGFDHVVWTPSENISDAKLFTEAEVTKLKSEAHSSALFSYTSPAGDAGFPGALDVEVLFALTNPARTFDPQTYERQLGSVILIYRAKVQNGPEGDGKKIVTPINLTHHWGFNLEASHATPSGPTPDVKAHKLYIKSDKILEGDSVLLPTGKLIDVKDTKFDFNEPNTIGSRYEGGYGESHSKFSALALSRTFDSRGDGIDHFYLFPPSPNRQPSHVPISDLKDGSQNLVSTIFEKAEPVTRLSSDKSGIRLGFHTNRTWHS